MLHNTAEYEPLAGSKPQGSFKLLIFALLFVLVVAAVAVGASVLVIKVKSEKSSFAYFRMFGQPFVCIHAASSISIGSGRH